MDNPNKESFILKFVDSENRNIKEYGVADGTYLPIDISSLPILSNLSLEYNSEEIKLKQGLEYAKRKQLSKIEVTLLKGLVSDIKFIYDGKFTILKLIPMVVPSDKTISLVYKISKPGDVEEPPREIGTGVPAESTVNSTADEKEMPVENNEITVIETPVSDEYKDDNLYAAFTLSLKEEYSSKKNRPSIPFNSTIKYNVNGKPVVSTIDEMLNSKTNDVVDLSMLSEHLLKTIVFDCYAKGTYSEAKLHKVIQNLKKKRRV